MKIQSLSVLVILVTMASLVAANEFKDFPSFNCRTSGNFSHPDKCTAWVHCDSNLTAFEVDCPICEDPTQCPDRLLHYNAERDTCDWASLAKCPPRECDITCMQQGFCDCFDTCLPDNSSSLGGLWHRGVYCDLGLYWNPDFNGIYHGGSCDRWENLSPEIQELYRLDKDCVTPKLDCYWEADPECDNKYYYLPENSKNVNSIRHLSCPVGLFWDQSRRTCGNCKKNPPHCTQCS